MPGKRTRRQAQVWLSRRLHYYQRRRTCGTEECSRPYSSITDLLAERALAPARHRKDRLRRDRGRFIL